MDKADTTQLKEKENTEMQKTEFLGWAINLFKKILEYNWMRYGTKKRF